MISTCVSASTDFDGCGHAYIAMEVKVRQMFGRVIPDMHISRCVCRNVIWVLMHARVQNLI